MASSSLDKGASRSAEMSLHAHFDPFPSLPSLYQTPCRVPAQDRMQSSSVRPQRLTRWDEVVEGGTPGEADCYSPCSPLQPEARSRSSEPSSSRPTPASGAAWARRATSSLQRRRSCSRRSLPTYVPLPRSLRSSLAALGGMPLGPRRARNSGRIGRFQAAAGERNAHALSSSLVS